MKNKLLSMLGFARKSGNLSFGFEQVMQMINKNKVKLVIISSDISENTSKKVIANCNNNNIPWIQWGSKKDLSHAIGQVNKTIFGVNNENFARQLMVYHNQMKEKG